MTVTDPLTLRPAEIDVRRRRRIQMFLWYSIGIPSAIACGIGMSLVVAYLREEWLVELGFWPWADAQIGQDAMYWILCAGFLGHFAAYVTLDRAGYCGRRSRGGMTKTLTPSVLAVASMLVGTLIGLRWWRQPTEPDLAPAPFGRVSSRGFEFWMVYTATWWFPGILALAALLMVFRRAHWERRNKYADRTPGPATTRGDLRRGTRSSSQARLRRRP